MRPLVSLLCFVLPVSALASMDYESSWHCDRSKFNWYCDLGDLDETRESQAATPQKTETDPADQAMKRLEALQQRLKALRAQAILEPTPQNVASYIRLQNEVTQQAATFSDVWRRVIWQNPDLNYELKRPVNNAGIETYQRTRWKAQTKTLEAIRQDWGIFFFFRADCPFCERMAATLRLLSDMHGLSVFPVSVDGSALPEYPGAARDNGLVERLGVSAVPMMVLANVRDKRLVPLGSGVVSIQDLIERIYILTSTRAGELY